MFTCGGIISREPHVIYGFCKWCRVLCANWAAIRADCRRAGRRGHLLLRRREVRGRTSGQHYCHGFPRLELTWRKCIDVCFPFELSFTTCTLHLRFVFVVRSQDLFWIFAICSCVSSRAPPYIVIAKRNSAAVCTAIFIPDGVRLEMKPCWPRSLAVYRSLKFLASVSEYQQA